MLPSIPVFEIVNNLKIVHTMAENSKLISISMIQGTNSNKSEHSSKRQTVHKKHIFGVLPRHPTQRHCPNRKLKIKRKKRRLPSLQEPSILELQEPESPSVAGCSFSFSQSSTSSSSSPQSPPTLINATTKKRKYIVDKCDGRGETALHKAAIKGDVQKVKLLLQKGANPNHQDYAGWTPLHEACIRGWYRVAQALLKAGADANTPGLHNVTALHDASAWSHLRLVKLLLRHGAKLSSKTDKGDTPVELASKPVLTYFRSHGLIPETGARVVEERTYEMRKSTYRRKVIKANSADVTFKIKVRCDQKGENRGTFKHGKKSKKKKSTSFSHSKKKMETEESKADTTLSTSVETNETSDINSSNVEEPEEASTATSTETAAASENSRSSVLVDDDDNEGNGDKKRKEKEEYPSKEEARVRDEQKKEEANLKIEEQPIKKEKEEQTATKGGKTSSTNSASPKSTTSADGHDMDDSKTVDSPEPKVPPLKIVIPQGEAEQGSRNGKNTNRHHPYVLVSNEETSTVSTVTTSLSSPSVPTTLVKAEPESPSSIPAPISDDQKIQQRVLRSTHSNRVPTTNSGNGSTSGSNSSVTSGSSSPAAADPLPQTEQAAAKDELKAVKTEAITSAKAAKSAETTGKSKLDVAVKMKSETEEESVGRTSNNDIRNSFTPHKEETSVVDLHPRKRKLKSKQEPTHNDTEHVTSFSSAPHPHEVPVTNCYQMFMDIRRQIDIKRKGLFPIQPKPPQGFKEYLMNRCTYTLAGNAAPRLKRRNTEPPEGVPEGMKELYLEQEAERYSLRMQHVVEKEKLVLSVEQEILRVHGRAARALANQALPFSACTILKDEEVYNVITPEQEEKDRNARSRYNGRLFISWLQDVDDKWEKIKEEMLARHHKEAESLNAIQKFRWDLRMRQQGLSKRKKFVSVDENCVPMISVSDDFDLLPE